MKKIFMAKKFILTCLFSVLLAAASGSTVHAANDDPGASRLSGENISEDFYEDTEDTVNSPIKLFRSAAFTTDSIYTGKSYEHQGVFLNRTIVNGIDVSQYQKDIDWTRVKAAGIDFAFVRVGYRGYSAGTLGSDPYYEKNMQNASAAGVNLGVYIFSQAITVAEAQEEAQYILDRLGSYPISMPLVLDYEYAGGSSGRLQSAKLSKADATAICIAFCDTIANAGYTPMVYGNKSMFSSQLNPADITAKGYRIWLANYVNYDSNSKETYTGKGTTYAGTFDFWQYSSLGTVDGISGNVDMNFYYMQEGDNFLQNAVTITSAEVAAIPDQAYTGSKITPDLSITYQGVPLQLNTDYTVSFSSNKKIGVATATITGLGTYKGTRTIDFKIVPKTGEGLTASKKTTDSITLSWTKNTSGTAYQIFRSTSLNGSYKRIKTISKNTTTTYVNTKLEAGQRYYYKIRSYKVVDGTKYYGAFSPVKAITTKSEGKRTATAKTDTYLYSSASTAGTVIATPEEDDTMSVSYYTLDENDKGWYYVTYETDDDTYKGFIRSNKVTITRTGKVVKTDVVNVRKSTSLSSKILTTLKKNQTVTVLSSKVKKGVTWYKVTFKKNKTTYTGWISSPYLKLK